MMKPALVCAQMGIKKKTVPVAPILPCTLEAIPEIFDNSIRAYAIYGVPYGCPQLSGLIGIHWGPGLSAYDGIVTAVGGNTGQLCWRRARNTRQDAVIAFVIGARGTVAVEDIEFHRWQ